MFICSVHDLCIAGSTLLNILIEGKETASSHWFIWSDGNTVCKLN